MTFTLWCECIKNSNASNLTFNNHKYLSITGTTIQAEGFIQRNQNLSEYLLDVRTTLCFPESLGLAVLEVTGDVFANRLEVDDLNPVIIIRVQADQVRQVAGGHLILDIGKADVIDSPEASLTPEVFKRRALELRMISNENRRSTSKRKQSTSKTSTPMQTNIPNSTSRRVFNEESGSRRRRSSSSTNTSRNVGLLLEDSLTF